jgi:hypothetical protein
MTSLALVTKPFVRSGRMADRMERYVGEIRAHRVWHSIDRNPNKPWVPGSLVRGGRVTFYADDPDGRFMPPPHNLRPVLLFPHLLQQRS